MTHRSGTEWEKHRSLWPKDLCIFFFFFFVFFFLFLQELEPERRFEDHGNPSKSWLLCIAAAVDSDGSGPANWLTSWWCVVSVRIHEEHKNDAFMAMVDNSNRIVHSVKKKHNRKLSPISTCLWCRAVSYHVWLHRPNIVSSSCLFRAWRMIKLSHGTREDWNIIQLIN